MSTYEYHSANILQISQMISLANSLWPHNTAFATNCMAAAINLFLHCYNYDINLIKPVFSYEQEYYSSIKLMLLNHTELAVASLDQLSVANRMMFFRDTAKFNQVTGTMQMPIFDAYLERCLRGSSLETFLYLASQGSPTISLDLFSYREYRYIWNYLRQKHLDLLVEMASKLDALPGTKQMFKVILERHLLDLIGDTALVGIWQQRPALTLAIGLISGRPDIGRLVAKLIGKNPKNLDLMFNLISSAYHPQLVGLFGTVGVIGHQQIMALLISLACKHEPSLRENIGQLLMLNPGLFKDFNWKIVWSYLECFPEEYRLPTETINLAKLEIEQIIRLTV